MVKYISIGAIVAAVWFFSFVLSLSLWPAAILTVLVVSVIGIAFAVRRYQKFRANRLLESALSEHADHANANIRPDQLPELEEVQREFERAVALLKKSKANEGKGGLYELPWYAIVGPPGAGKSTAIRNSGLSFPYLSERSSGAVQGLGGTRNCDWWFTNESIILDTAGRWSTHDEDRSEWFSFLKLLKRYRRKHPLNGLIVAVSIADIASFTEDARSNLARKIRDRIDEAGEQLGISLPIYVLLTKCDLLEGFVETFGDLSRAERAQAWGFTLALDAPVDLEHAVQAELRTLIASLEQASLARASAARRLSDRERVLAFPRQLGDLDVPISDFITELFKDDVYRETPHFRGLYLTSGTQEGRPFNRLLAKISTALNVATVEDDGGEKRDPKSYFLLDPFQKVMFADKDIAVLSAAAAQRAWWLRTAITSLLIIGALFMLIAPTYSWLLNRSLLQSIETQSIHTEKYLRNRNARQTISPRLLHNVSNTLETLRFYEMDGPPPGYRAGMYAGSAMIQPLADTHARLFRGGVLTNVGAAMVTELRGLVRRYEGTEAPPPPDEHSRFSRLLRGYLLITSPQEANQPSLDDAMRSDLAALIQDIWAEMAGFSSTQKQAIAPDIDAYLKALSRDLSLAIPRDAKLVGEVRSVMSRASSVDLAIDTMLASFDGPTYDIDVRKIVGNSVKSITAEEKVRGGFTRKAWEEFFAKEFGSEVGAGVPNAWVLNVGTTDIAATKTSALRTRYLERYVEAWMSFVQGLKVTAPRGQKEALSQLQELSRGTPPPLSRLFSEIASQTTLFDAPAEVAAPKEEQGVVASVRSALTREREETGEGHTVELPPIETVSRPFASFLAFAGEGEGAPTKLADYSRQLVGIRDALQTELESPGEANVLRMRIQDARTSVQGMLAEEDAATRGILENLLWPPIEGASASYGHSEAKRIAQAWCDEVVSVYDRTLHGRYPFAKGGRDASIDDVVSFFQQNEGTVSRFFDASLSGMVSRRGDSYSYNTQLGRRTGRVFSSQLIDFLGRAREVDGAFGGGQPNVQFEIRLRPNTKVAVQSFEVGGERIEYHNGPEKWQRLSWPGKSPSKGARLEARGAGGLRTSLDLDGDWGFFRLIERGIVSATAEGSFRVTWSMPGHDIELAAEIRPVQKTTLFWGGAGSGRSRAFLGGLRAAYASMPRDLIPGSRDCRRGGN